MSEMSEDIDMDKTAVYPKEAGVVKFISYDGKYPNLCRGTLKFTVDGEPYQWGNCLQSGGSAYFTNDYHDSHVEKGDWTIEVPAEFVEKSKPWIKALEELVNKHVEKGCCGGCL